MRLLLIRHGQTPSNLLGLLDTGIPGPGLTELGVKQAAALPATLAAQRIDAIYTSTHRRTRLTAAPLAAARGLDMQARMGLREVGAGELEMLGDDESIHTYQATIRQWMTGAVQVAMPGGETGAEVLTRFDAVVREVVAAVRRDAGEDGRAVLVAHGAVLRLWAIVRATEPAAVQDALGRPHALHNTGMIVVESRPTGGWRLISWEGRAIGGATIDDGSQDGPAGEDLAEVSG